MRPRFIFTLTNGSDPNELPNAPEEWLKLTVKHARSAKYGGVVRSLTTPNMFVRGAATYLRSALYSQGVTSRRYLDVQKLVPRTGLYRQLYYGRVDFTTAKDTRNGFEANCTEKGIQAQVDAKEDIDYALPLVGDDVIDVTINGLVLEETADYIATPRPDFAADAFNGLQLVTNQQLANKVSSQKVDYDQVTNPEFSTSIHWFYEAQIDGIWSAKIHLDLRLQSNLPSSNQYRLAIYKNDASIVKVLLDMTGGFDDFPVTADFDVAIPMIKGERLFLYGNDVGGTPQPNTGFKFSANTTIKASYKTKSDPSTCKAISAYNVFRRLIANINRGEDAVVPQSVLLKTELAPLYYTCQNSILTTQVNNIYQAGEDIQQGASYEALAAPVNYFLPNGVAQVFSIGERFAAVIGKDTFTSPGGGFVRQVNAIAQLIINFKDFFKDIYGIKGGQAAFGVEQNNPAIEDLSWAYRSAVTIMDLGSKISSFSCRPNPERLYNSITIGQRDQQYDAINGSKEVASEVRYTVQQDLVNNELDLTVAHRYDPYGIEQIRAIPANVYGNTAASRSNNDVFMLWLDPTLDHPLTLAEGTKMYSGADGTYYNWMLAPERNLQRGSRFLASIFDGMQGDIRFESGEKNTSLITVDLDGLRTEGGTDIPIPSLGTQIFKPYIFSFDCDQDNDAGIKLQATPYGAIKCLFLDIPIKGHIVAVTTDEGLNSSQNFEIEASADMNMLTLVR